MKHVYKLRLFESSLIQPVFMGEKKIKNKYLVSRLRPHARKRKPCMCERDKGKVFFLILDAILTLAAWLIESGQSSQPNAPLRSC
jgi:hypothetical protein